MPCIEKININNSNSIQNIKNVLGHAVKERRGYYSRLRSIGKGSDIIDKCKTFNLITTERTRCSEIYHITKAGDEYYKDLFGTFDYWKKRLSGILERFLKRHI